MLQSDLDENDRAIYLSVRTGRSWLEVRNGGRVIGTHTTHAAPGDAACPPIYIEASVFDSAQLTGIARYAARLSLALGARAPVRFFYGDETLAIPAGLDWTQDQDLTRFTRRVWRGWREPIGTPPPGSVGLYTSPRHEGRRFEREAMIAYDFAPLVVPDTCTEGTRSVYRGFYADVLPTADLVVAISESTRADAAWLTDVDPARVVAAYPGGSMCIGRHEYRGRRPVLRRPDVGLVVSTLEPRKNPRFLMDWFRRTAVLPPYAEIWWVGALGWLLSEEELAGLAATSGRRIKFLGFVPDAELCRLYQEAGWFIYPSLYEGFGLPVLDALRHGMPVLTSGNSSLREFTGPGVHFFDPCDFDSLDRAWLEFRSTPPPNIDLAALDRIYHWDRTADVILDFASGRRRSGVPSPHVSVGAADLVSIP